MAKKDKVQFQHSTDLDSVDTELADAMEQLDQTNTRISELLRTFDPSAPVSITPGAELEAPGTEPVEAAMASEMNEAESALQSEAVRPEETSQTEEAPEDATASEPSEATE